MAAAGPHSALNSVRSTGPGPLARRGRPRPADAARWGRSGRTVPAFGGQSGRVVSPLWSSPCGSGPPVPAPWGGSARLVPALLGVPGRSGALGPALWGGSGLLVPALWGRSDPGGLPVAQEGPVEARRRAEEILARPEFRPEPKSLVERGLDGIGELFGKILGGIGGGNVVLAWLAVAVVSALLGLVLWRAVRALQADPGTRSGVAVDGRRRPATDWRAEAAAHEAAGRWRDALRCTWRATVADLSARGLLDEVPGRTTGEYRTEVARSLPDAADSFSRATALFEDAWYAAVEIGPEQSALAATLGDRVLAEARR